ncbi:metal-dependent hydrolase [uncultured Methanolobus sp.]|uniref:metal-dependent hydrolase n=1 Tax=uncultured Methanolobus sp. TaxID=218300 RepID=UPI0029C69E63|nr:metal-dependent hydrolase [uncultured Methanolobus sp.]
MLPFAHIGMTLVLFYMAARTFPRLRPHINYWYVATGSMLPDIIDKPVGMILFKETFASGRIFAHTLLFVLVLAIAGYYLYSRRKDARVLILAGGGFVHQMLDSMWSSPETFLWPLLGWEFARKVQYVSFWQYLFTAYGNLANISNQYILLLLMSEIFGLAVTLAFGLSYFRIRMKAQKTENK